VLGGSRNNQSILIEGPYEMELFGGLPKYFTVPLGAMRPPGKISFRSTTPNTEFTVHVSYFHNMPSESNYDWEVTVKDKETKIFKLIATYRG
jgi:hypothetical protein